MYGGSVDLFLPAPRTTSNIHYPQYQGQEPGAAAGCLVFCLILSLNGVGPVPEG
jgi:hypothetical protein